jgi:hypothetical protein
MSDPQQLEKDLREYLEKEPNLRRADRLSYLMIIFNKHFGLSKIEHLVNKDDLFGIISGAKQEYVRQSTHLNLSGKPVDKSESPHVAMIESFISYLNRQSLLKKAVRFDYTDTSNSYEGDE